MPTRHWPFVLCVLRGVARHRGGRRLPRGWRGSFAVVGVVCRQALSLSRLSIPLNNSAPGCMVINKGCNLLLRGVDPRMIYHRGSIPWYKGYGESFSGVARSRIPRGGPTPL